MARKLPSAKRAKAGEKGQVSRLDQTILAWQPFFEQFEPCSPGVLFAQHFVKFSDSLAYSDDSPKLLAIGIADAAVDVA